MTTHATTTTLAMVRDPFARDEPDLQAVLDALDDPDCRAIVEQLDDPMTASELAEYCDIPSSTMYRKLDLLSDASLIDEQSEIKTTGRHTTRYVRDFETVHITCAGDRDDRAVDVTVERRSQSPDEQLSDLWTEVRKET